MKLLKIAKNYKNLLNITGSKIFLINKKGYCTVNLTENNLIFIEKILNELEKYEIKNIKFQIKDYKNKNTNLIGINFLKNMKKIRQSLEKTKNHPLIKQNIKKNKELRTLYSITDIKTQKGEQLLSENNNNSEYSTITNYPIKKIFIELTKNCNLNCQMCGHSSYFNKSYFNMDPDLFKQIADELFKDAEFVDLRGFGESMLYPYWNKIFPIIKKYKCDFGMITNLTTKNDKLHKEMIEHDMWLQASWDGGTKETFEKIRKNSKWEQVIHNLKLITEYKQEIKSKSRIEFIITVQGDNIKELVKIVEIGIKHNIDGFVFSPIVSGNPHDKNCLWAHQNELKKQLPKAVKLAQKHNKKIQIISSFYGVKEIEKYLNFEKLTHCNRPWSWIFIDYAGNVGPCNHLMDDNFILGNIKDYKNILQLRNNESFQILRAMIDTKNKLKHCNFCYSRRFDN